MSEVVKRHGEENSLKKRSITTTSEESYDVIAKATSEEVGLLEKTVKKGKFITLEGPEGSGKSTQSSLLVRYLRKRRFRVVYTREPGGTRIGERIRQLLLDPKRAEMSGWSEALLYMANRAQLVEEVILPALKAGKIVVCDRFQDATVAYQGYGGGLNIRVLKQLGALVTHKFRPDLTILLDIETAEGLRRCRRTDRIEKKSIFYHRRVRRGYLKMAKQEPSRIKVVTVRDKVKQTQSEIRRLVLNVIQRNKGTR